MTPPSPVWVSLRAEGLRGQPPFPPAPCKAPQEEPGPSSGHRRAVLQDGASQAWWHRRPTQGRCGNCPEHPSAFWFAPKSLGPSCMHETHMRTHPP